METKNLLKSKRFWTGAIALITSVSIILTGEKSLNDALPEIILGVVGIIQTVLGITSNKQLEFSGKTFGKKSDRWTEEKV
jgi:hypothetical protein